MCRQVEGSKGVTGNKPAKKTTPDLSQQLAVKAPALFSHVCMCQRKPAQYACMVLVSHAFILSPPAVFCNCSYHHER
jgi:hypothetical protein